MANVRTATTATDRSSTGGIWAARVISQGDTPARASALPSERDPSAIAARMRVTRGRNSGNTSDRRITRLISGDHFDDPVTNRDDPSAVPHDHHGGTRTG